jgi:DNA-binding transcriptional ArsR family regulator
MTASAALKVLGDTQRRAILDLLRDGERPVGELVTQLRQSQPAVSKNLRILREAGLVGVRPVGQRRLYHVEPGPLVALDSWLSTYRQLWEASLDRLEDHLKQRRSS